MAAAAAPKEAEQEGEKKKKPILKILLFVIGGIALIGTAVPMKVSDALLDAARRRRLRSTMPGTRPALPSMAQVRTEMMLRSLDAPSQLARLDVALRAVGRSVAEGGACVLVVVVGRLGDVRMLTSSTASLPAPWARAAAAHGVGAGIRGDWWSLPATVPLEYLAGLSRSDAPPCPALVHLGATDDGECFVDLEAIGLLEVEPSVAPNLIDTLDATLRVSPFVTAGRVVRVVTSSRGDDGAATGGERQQVVAPLDADS